MNIILLSGGSGKRLWPLSNDIRSKQFIKIFKKPDHDIHMGTEYTGDYESMVQRIYRQIKSVDPDATVTIATSKSQVSAIHNQLGEHIGISVEPCRRDTFAAIALATAYLHDVRGVSAEEAVVVCPVDPYVEEGYFRTLRAMCEVAQKGKKNLILMGIAPTYPSEKYGYIKPSTGECGEQTWGFTEKPDKKKAQAYISQGALWNGGVFAYKLSYVLEKSNELLGTSEYDKLFNSYTDLKKISFDYAVVEQETSIDVITYNGTWKDLGTWNTLTEAMEESTVGDVRMNDNCRNVHAINELGVPILIMGMKDCVVSASPEGILVSDKEQSSYIKPFVDAIDQQIMFAEKSWGSYRVLDVEEDSMTVKVTLNPGHKMNYHSHEKRDEVWTVISGTGIAVIDDKAISVNPGDVLSMPIGCKHTIHSGENGLQLIEVQLGKEISVRDKIKYKEDNRSTDSYHDFNLETFLNKIYKSNRFDSDVKRLCSYVNEALDTVYENDKKLIRCIDEEMNEYHVAERAIVFRFAHYLQLKLYTDNILKKYDLDCEYNRNLGNLKSISVDFEKGTYPDVILHSRGNNNKNWMAIEFKGYWNANQISDIKKLKGFTDQHGEYKYKIGLAILLGKTKEETLVRVYRNGEEVVD